MNIRIFLGIIICTASMACLSAGEIRQEKASDKDEKATTACTEETYTLLKILDFSRVDGLAELPGIMMRMGVMGNQEVFPQITFTNEESVAIYNPYTKITVRAAFDKNFSQPTPGKDTSIVWPEVQVVDSSSMGCKCYLTRFFDDTTLCLMPISGFACRNQNPKVRCMRSDPSKEYAFPPKPGRQVHGEMHSPIAISPSGKLAAFIDVNGQNVLVYRFSHEKHSAIQQKPVKSPEVTYTLSDVIDSRSIKGLSNLKEIMKLSSPTDSFPEIVFARDDENTIAIYTPIEDLTTRFTFGKGASAPIPGKADSLNWKIAWADSFNWQIVSVKVDERMGCTCYVTYFYEVQNYGLPPLTGYSPLRGFQSQSPTQGPRLRVSNVEDSIAKEYLLTIPGSKENQTLAQLSPIALSPSGQYAVLLNITDQQILRYKRSPVAEVPQPEKASETPDKDIKIKQIYSEGIYKASKAWKLGKKHKGLMNLEKALLLEKSKGGKLFPELAYVDEKSFSIYNPFENVTVRVALRTDPATGKIKPGFKTTPGKKADLSWPKIEIVDDPAMECTCYLTKFFDSTMFCLMPISGKDSENRNPVIRTGGKEYPLPPAPGHQLHGEMRSPITVSPAGKVAFLDISRNDIIEYEFFPLK